MRRIEPAFPDLLTVSHLVRPGWTNAKTLSLDPLRMRLIWPQTAERSLPKRGWVPRPQVEALAYAQSLAQRPEVAPTLLERGSSLLVVLDDPTLGPEQLGLDATAHDRQVRLLLPILPSLLTPQRPFDERWAKWPKTVILGLFPLPRWALDEQLQSLVELAPQSIIGCPLLLTRRERRQLLDRLDGHPGWDELHHAFFHARVADAIVELERECSRAIDAAGLEEHLGFLSPTTVPGTSARVARSLGLWARRLDLLDGPGSQGWKLRRAAHALKASHFDVVTLAAEDNLRVLPGMDSWVEDFTRGLDDDREPFASVRKRWHAKT